VNSGVVALDIRQDVYSAWIRWFEREENQQFLPAMRFSGLDPIPGGFTGDTYFLINDWKLLYDPRKVAINGVLYSDDYETPYFFVEDESAVFPATVASLVNTAVTKENVVTGDLDSIISALQVINAGVKKSSLLIPHSTDI
jgi:hypothetical protein